ncbi:flavin-dependent monooxygenase [Spongiactinospora gelatinilytica]|uniref:Flavin-dependent monooxygenase n=1 Tax=Spongiactinospora gelatinilytica TaxID=2666298 RepID=A0A2W2HGT4_9ACTN|nr:3-hydroxy-9,10-secoandrosta-1,3,5(10)-triene-9,17-dione monooxygenase oxygenase subunit [Spongiactinospora gelatinilytica]PZG38224.1 flavin-dependent monooxygenase [Spongiactinospora gelatinilytica]
MAVIDTITELKPRLAERVAQAESQADIPAATIKDLVESRLFDMLKPAAFGGLECHPRDFYECVRELGGVCGSTAWVSAVLGVHPWQLALFPPQAQHDVWDGDGDALMASSYAPTGTVTPAEGGYRLSGRWSFCSGVRHCQWVLLGGSTRDEDGRQTDRLTFLLPAADYSVENVWDAVGLRGTGSDDVVVEDAYVPAHRTLSWRELSDVRGPGQELNDSPLYRLPFPAILSTTISTPLLGIAQGGYQAHVAMMRKRVRVSYGGQRVALDPFAHIRVARAASEIDAGWLQLMRNIDEAYLLAEAGRPIPMDLRRRLRRDQVRATERAVYAMELLFENSGGRSLRSGNAIERAWRDVHAGRAHAANDPERAFVLFGTGEFRLDVTDPML